MPRSNFSLFKDGVTIGGVGLDVYSHGTHYYVCNGSVLTPKGLGGSDGNDGLTADRPLSTIDAAVNKCTASRGDVIVVMPGHAEAISSATALNLDIAGITIVGVGTGSSRPTITLDTATTTTIPVSAANISIYNCIFTANFADVVSFFTTTTAKNFTLDGCYFKATATNMNSLYVVDTSTVDNDADGLTIRNCLWIEPDLATVGLVKQDATQDRVTIKDNYFNLGVNNNKSLVTIATGKIVTSLDCGYNKLYRLNTDSATGGLLLSTDGTTNTGCMYNNFVQHADVAAEILLTLNAGIGVFDNKASGVAGASGYLLPATDS